MLCNQKYITLLKEIADNYLDDFEEKGYAVSGHNGPYGHTDTPARNTAHWCIIYGYLWKITGNQRYLILSRKFADYLITLQQESISGAVKCMMNNSYNHMNGLIGQAWIIEALVYVYSITKESKYLCCAEKIFNVPHFEPTQHMWEMIELDGRNIGYDYTFNHQLWFAASGSLILDYVDSNIIKSYVMSYLDGCQNHMQIHKDGLIKHYGDLPSPFYRESAIKTFIKRTAKKTVFKNRRFINPNRYDPDGYERGYHLFNLYAFAILKQRFDTHPLFQNFKLTKAIEYGKKMDIHNDYFNVENVIAKKPNAEMNKYAYGYNSPAFEYPYIYSIFGADDFDAVSEKLFKIQLEATYDPNNKCFAHNNYDPETLTARIYELVRYLEYIK